MGRAVGVLGGAFNPPHVGHLVLAQEALFSLGLDELILVPTGEAAHKRIDPEPGPSVRLAMARAAVEGVEGVRVSDVEVGREGPSYAYRTLELLLDELPESDLTFVMGADVAAGLESWERPERVVELARIAVAARPGIDRSVVDGTLERLDSPREPVTIEMPELEISSTMVRERVADGKPVRWLVPDAVAAMIERDGIYAGVSAGSGGEQ
jgi:nicotinate-nucleotide adenylyltransferase